MRTVSLISLFTTFVVQLMAVEPVERVAQVRVIEFPGLEKPDGMWSALYTASSGKVYTGLCTHGGSALFFEYDPATDRNRLVADIGLFLGENGRGERTHGKIHTRFAEESAGNIYLGESDRKGHLYLIMPTE